MRSPRLARIETIPCYALWLFNSANWIAYLAREPNWFHFDEGIVFWNVDVFFYVVGWVVNYVFVKLSLTTKISMRCAWSHWYIVSSKCSICCLMMF